VGEDNLLGTLFPLLLIVLAFWLLVIRPARKRQHDMTRIQNSVTIGSDVMLGSGIYGTVVGVGDDTISLAVAPGTEVKVARQAVVRVLDDANADGVAKDRPTDTPEQP
jgi:preprotein translocase subunit YajC